jgi:hypothetical protein
MVTETVIIGGGKDPAMDPVNGTDEQVEPSADTAPPRSRASAWLWRPWYAKTWWTCIAIYWLPAGGPTRIPAIADFYETAWAAIPNLLFLPITAIVVLGFGYFRRLLTNGEPSDGFKDIEFGTRRLPGMPHPTMDELDPRSGPRWIGNRPFD